MATPVPTWWQLRHSQCDIRLRSLWVFQNVVVFGGGPRCTKCLSFRTAGAAGITQPRPLIWPRGERARTLMVFEVLRLALNRDERCAPRIAWPIAEWMIVLEFSHVGKLPRLTVL